MNDNHPMTDITCKCNWCECTQTFTVKVGIAKRYYEWEEKYLQAEEPTESITNIFPDMPAGEREMLISNTCEDCWNSFFG